MGPSFLRLRIGPLLLRSRRNEHMSPLRSSMLKPYKLVVQERPSKQTPNTYQPVLNFLGSLCIYHLKTLISKLPSLISSRRIDPAISLILFRHPLDRGYSFFEGLMHSATQDGMSNIITQIIWPYEKNVDTRHFSNRVNLTNNSMSALLFGCPKRDIGRLGTSTFSNASFVSICTIVTRLPFACCRYSDAVRSPNGPIAKGEPKPRCPIGGNLAAWTNFLASSAV